MSWIRQKAIRGLRVGDTFSVSRTFNEKDVKDFAHMTRDYNPVHFDERFTAVKALKGRICHGLLVASMISEIGGQMGWLASEMTFRFKKPIYWGETIVCELTITHIDSQGRAEAEAVYHAQDDTVVMETLLKGIIPGHEEREVMRTMVAEGDPTNRTGRPAGPDSCP